ncbi:MAG: hypothetical protein A4E19_17005 [Nitrospira sp. SG-bin1]|nr:MAG: hypothetical protein A4E19_17005 [Nitrospira sp. SG-bin1]
MAKFVTVLLLIIGAFGAGYYIGQRPVGSLQRTVAELQQSLKDVSRNVMDTTLEIERDLRRRQGLVEAKARLIQAKTHLADRDYEKAAKELTEAITSMDGTTKGANPDPTTTPLREMAGSLREVKADIAAGNFVPMKRLDELQQRLDQLLNK